MAKAPAHADSKGWVLFDADCGICTRLAESWRPYLEGRGFEVEPLQSDWVAPELGMTPEEAVSDFRVITIKGKRFAGANAYRYLLRQYSWGLLPWILVSIPPFRWIFDQVYRAIAKNRRLISKSCGLR